MPLSKQEIANLYRRRAKRYDFTAQLYYLAGFREWAYRTKAVEALALKRGDTVVELGCGTGLNFGLLESRIGPQGRIIGVDLTDSMLAGAKERSRRNGWSNVELVQSDAASFEFPRKLNGIISTFALTLVPEYEKVIHAGAEALASDGRFVILDFKLPWNWLSLLAPVIVLALRPFGGTLDAAGRHPWGALQKHFDSVSMTELYGGIAYIAVGREARIWSQTAAEVNGSRAPGLGGGPISSELDMAEREKDSDAAHSNNQKGDGRMPKRLKVQQRQLLRHRRMLAALTGITIGMLVILLLVGKRNTTAAEPTIPRGAPLASWNENGRGGQYVLQILDGATPPPGVTVSGVVASDTACQPDALGFNHCHNEIDFANGAHITVVNTHVMRRYRCLRPGEAITLTGINASWVLAKVS